MNELRALLARASLGPWLVSEAETVKGIEYRHISSASADGLSLSFVPAADAELIVAAINGLPALLDAADALRRVTPALDNAMTDYVVETEGGESASHTEGDAARTAGENAVSGLNKFRNWESAGQAEPASAQPLRYEYVVKYGAYRTTFYRTQRSVQAQQESERVMRTAAGRMRLIAVVEPARPPALGSLTAELVPASGRGRLPAERRSPL